jgi:hypothetical protein
MTTTIQQGLDKIESWLSRKGFALLKSKNKTIEDEVDFNRKVVFLSLRSSPINQVYSLLHECGHIIVRGKKDYKHKFCESVAIEEGLQFRETNRSIVEKIEEEILAWREGYVLSQKLNLNLVEKEYFKYGFRWVMSYIVRGSIGKEHYLPSAKWVDEDSHTKNQITQTELAALLDNAHETCYNGLISETPNKDQ